MPAPKTTAKRAGTSPDTENVWSDEERAAMQARVRERKAAARLSPEEERVEGEREVRGKLAEMPSPDREMGERIHELITTNVPDLLPRTYYGMPAYARDGRTICFFKPASKFRVRYATLGFQPDAHLDDGEMWPTEFAVIRLTAAVEAQIVALVKKAAG